MSLTIKQMPNNIEDSNYIYPHASQSPAFIVVSSSNVAGYYDFQYHFRIYDTNNLVFESLQTPTEDGYGILNVKNIIESLTEMDFNEVSSVSSTNHLAEYKITCQEFYSETTGVITDPPADHGTEDSFSISLAANYKYNQTDSVIPFSIINNRWGNFLSDMESEKTYKGGVNAVANIWASGDTSFQTITKYVYILHVKNKSSLEILKWFYSLDPLATYTFNSAATDPATAINGIVKIPAGISNLDETTIQREGYLTSDGTWTTDSASQTGILANITSAYEVIGLEMRIQNGNTFIDTSDVVSDILIWNFDNCANKDISLSWENSYGATDYFSFNLVRQDKLNSKLSTFYHNTYSIDSSGLMLNDLSENNIDAYDNINSYEFEIKTEFLNKEEIQFLKGLFNSNKVVMFIDSIRYPVIRISNQQIISSKEKIGLILYKFKVQYGKIIK